MAGEWYVIFCWIGYCILIVIAIPIIMFALFVSKIVINRLKYRHIPGPPTRSFFRGNTNIFTNEVTVNRQKAIIQLFKDYGPLVKLNIYHFTIFMVSSPQAAKEILTKSKHKKIPEAQAALRVTLGVPFLGNSISVIPEYKEWKVRRHAHKPNFHRAYLEKLIPVFNEAGDKMTDALRSYADTGKTVTLIDIFNETTLTAICRAAYSFDYRERKGTERLPHLIRLCGEAFQEYNYNRRVTSDRSKREKVQEYQTALKTVRLIMTEVLEERLECFGDGKETPNDMLDMLLDGLLNQCSKEDIISEMVGLLIGGVDTTAATLSSLMMELGRQPEIVRHIRREISQVIGDKPVVENEDLNQLHWVTACLKETHRIYPPALGLVRATGEDIILSGYKIPKGSFVYVSFAALHQLYHEDGSEFRPEKWLPKSGPSTNLFNYMPFSVGQRSCIGRQFALMEAKILVAKFFQRYIFHLDSKETFDFIERLAQFPVSGTCGQVEFAKTQ